MSLATATRSEITKQFSTSTWWILAIVLVVYVAFVTGGLAAAMTFLADSAGGDAGMPTTDGAPSLLYSFAASLGYVFALLIGALMVTTEYRHKTLTPTLLATPQRGRALLASHGMVRAQRLITAEQRHLTVVVDDRDLAVLAPAGGL